MLGSTPLCQPGGSAPATPAPGAAAGAGAGAGAELERLGGEERELEAALEALRARRAELEGELAAEAAAPPAPARKPLGLRKGRRRRKKVPARRPAAPAAAVAPAAPAPPASPEEPPWLQEKRGGWGEGDAAGAAAAAAISEEALLDFPVSSTSSWEELDKSFEQLGRDRKAQSEMDQDTGLEFCTLPKPIYLLSDCTGESASHVVRAALKQFESCQDVTCPANLVTFRFIENPRDVFDVVRRAGQDDALLVYTLVDTECLTAARTASSLHNVKSVDMWSTLLEYMEEHLNMQRMGQPLQDRARAQGLSQDYFRMIEAVEYTRKMDDGSNPGEWKDCDLLLLGVSRTGKTPLSIFLGQRGYKVANLPLVPGVPPPPELFEIDQEKIVGLLIDPQVLLQIRTNRLENLFSKNKGVGAGSAASYSEIRSVRAEIAAAKELFDANPRWPVMDVTFRSVEETAARILKFLYSRRGNPLSYIDGVDCGVPSSWSPK